MRRAADGSGLCAPDVSDSVGAVLRALAAVDVQLPLRGQAVYSAAPRDPDLFRYMLATINVLQRDSGILEQPDVAERAVALADPTPLPGPDREELLAIAHADPALRAS